MKGSWIGRFGKWAATAAVAVVALGSQASAQDFPMLKGDAIRSGKGTAANTSGPGSGLLKWVHPDATDNAGAKITIDNLNRPNPVTDPAYVTEVGTWVRPADAEEASAPYIPPNLNNPPAGVAYPDPTLETRSGYYFAESIASATGSDPTAPLNATDPLSTFTWSIRNPVTPFFEARSYSIYVHLPTGSTTVAGVQRFPQRFFVYKITYSGGTYIDVVDTDKTGGGWVRLGNGGLPTNVMFPADGATPIQVTLYNTVPRDPDTGQLTTNPAPPSNDLNLSLPRPIVYADAVMAVPQLGSYAATPIVSQVLTSSGLQTRTVGILNQLSVGTRAGSLITNTVGAVSSYAYDTGARAWTFTPLQESDLTLTIDNEDTTQVTRTGTDWDVAPTPANNYRGTNYFQAVTITDPLLAGTASTVEYKPASMNPGPYEIYVWIPGDSNGQTFAHALQYEVHEGATITTVNIDQSVAAGWVKIGTRRFTHDPAGANNLSLVVTNFSTDPTDSTRLGFTDAVRFVGPTNLTINSTPVQATVRMRMTRGGAPEDHSIVLVAAENGVLYCLDAGGRGDGTTDVLWTYPSTRDSEIPEPAPGSPDPWKDPNLNPADATNTDWDTIDGTNNQRIAQMPTGFGLSSAVIARVGGEDFLYIGASNGRVYCIEMAGRGDFDLAKRKPGTTRRVWSFPNDYPAVGQPSSLESFVGSVAFENIAAGPTVFVPTMQGRMYALDAAGTPATHTTTTRWAYPPLNSATLGPISSTPAVDFGKVYFGTQSKDGVSPGQFLALDQETGALAWTFTGATQPLSDFNGGPVTTSAITVGGGMTDTVFASNDNRGIYAIDAATGNMVWETYESAAPTRAPLTYTVMSVPDSVGTLTAKPVIIAPQSDGQVSVFNAQTNDLTVTAGRFAKGYKTQSQSLTASVAVGWNYMYIADNAGYLYGLTNTAGSFPPGEPPPLEEVGGGNTPGNADYSQAKVKLMTKAAFLQLRQNTMYYADALDPANSIARTPMAFEWGETLYLMVYDFPYKRAGTSVPPVINVNFAVGGQTIRNVFTEARLFPGDLNNDLSDGVQPFPEDNPHGGYAILSFAIQSAGANALPPGAGEISIGFNTTDTTGSPINYPSVQRQTVFVANPLGLVVPSPVGPLQAVGETNETSNAYNLQNGTPLSVPIFGTFGTVAHGQNSGLQIGVVDRSLVALIRGPGKGLQNVRLERNDLAWQPGTNVEGEGKPINPIDPILFPNYEDLPVQIPNISLDYPDIGREQVTAVKGALEAAENPASYPVELIGPTASDGTDITEANANTRAVRTTPFDFTVNIPLYQPANQSKTFDANGGSQPAIPAGYAGTYYIFVDSSGNGTLDRPNSFIETDSEEPSATREAFRNLQLGAGVPPDLRLAVLTPTVDLGALAETTGYTPAAPGPGNAVFDVWSGTYQELFKPFEVAILGNTNFLNLRLAKATTTDDAAFEPWKIFSNSNEDLAYLDGDFDIWSDMDPKYAPTRDLSPDAPVIGQKSRVGDRSPRHVSPNPVIRFNPNLGVVNETGRLPEATYPVGPPRIAVTVPFGFPVGTYSGLVRVIEDNALGSNAAAMAQNLDPSSLVPTEEYSDPTLRLIAKVREARVTSFYSSHAAPMVDNLFSGSEHFRYTNLQPSGFRHPSNGGLVMAMSSNRDDWVPGTALTQAPNNAWRIFVSSVQGTDPASGPGSSPLRDLYGFTPDLTNGRWFVQSPQTVKGFPDSSLDDALFNTQTGEAGVAGTARYGSPVFSATGMLEPFRNPNAGIGTPLPNSLMAFVGERQVKSGDGTMRSESKIFVAPVTVDPSGAVGIGDAYAMTNDPLASKGRPSIVQTTNGFYLFYSATIGGRSNIYVTMPSNTPGASQYDGSYFGDSIALDLGEGFESVTSPSAVGRLYRGITDTENAEGRVIELVFSGKLRGRSVSEVFYGRIGLDASNIPAGLVTLPVRTREQLTAGGESGLYLADGVRWVRDTPVSLGILRNGVYTDLAAGAQDVERDSGTITFNTKLGGKAYLDPNMGTVRLTGALPPKNVTVVLTYQPRLLRVSEGTSAGYTSPNLGIDDRLIPDISYWFRGGDQSPVASTDPVRSNRFLITYGRAAAGAGQAARPVMKSMRLGVELPLPVFTDKDGSIESISVTATNPAEPGALQYYQVDPSKKRVYFTAEDEDRSVTITYTAADEATGQRIDTPVTVTARVNLIVERGEELLPLDQATNETNVSMFMDPFDPASIRRPGLVWLFWSSTRAGSPDVYMETIAPRFTPVVAGK